MGKRISQISLVVTALVVWTVSAYAEPLLKDAQIVVFVGKSGILNGDTNRHVYRAATGTLEPVRKPRNAYMYQVLKNTALQVVFRGPRDTCTLTADHKFTCPRIGNGTWKVQ